VTCATEGWATALVASNTSGRNFMRAKTDPQAGFSSRATYIPKWMGDTSGCMSHNKASRLSTHGRRFLKLVILSSTLTLLNSVLSVARLECRTANAEYGQVSLFAMTAFEEVIFDLFRRQVFETINYVVGKTCP
jgi:hypothetical protein